MKTLRKLLVQQLAFSWDTKMFGTTFRHLRVVNILMPLFCMAGLFNLLTPGFGFIQILAFAPFAAVWLIWMYYFKANPPKMPELDWEQEFQYASKTKNDTPHIRKLRQQWLTKYKGREKFVEALRFLVPWIAIILTAIIWMIFGEAPEGVNSRFF